MVVQVISDTARTLYHTYYLLCHASVHNMRKFNFRGALQQNQNSKLVSCFSIPMSQLRSQSSPAALVGFDLSMSYAHKRI